MAAGQTLDWSDVADLAAGASFELRFTAAPTAGAASDPGAGSAVDHVNTASATGDDASGRSANGSGPYASTADTAAAQIHEADLSLDKEILTAGPYLQGQTVDYRVTVTNAGPDTATGVEVDEILDGGDLLWRATVAVDGTYDQTTGVWELPDLSATDSATLDLRVEIIGTGSITNRAQVTASDRYDPDSAPGNAATTSEDDDDSVTITAGTASIGSTVWYDLDASGGDESTRGVEPGIGGVTVNLLSAGNDDVFGTSDDFLGPDGVAATADDITTTALVTDAAGNYSFTDLPDGTYRISIDTATLPGGSPGWSATHDDNGGSDDLSGDITLTAADPSYVDADFAYTGRASLGDELFWDVDASGDGNLAGPDRPIPTVDVALTWAGRDDLFGTADDVTYPDATTGSGGTYGFANLPPGEFRVAVDTTDPEFPVGLDEPTWDAEHTAPGGGDGDPGPTADVTLAPGQDRTDIDFSFAGSGSIGDVLWLDLDGDGAQSPGEPGLPGVEVGLVWYGPDGVAGGGDDQSFTTVTDPDGGYGFDGLPAGTFSVTIITSDPDFPAGVTASHDLDGTGSADTTVVTLTTLLHMLGGLDTPTSGEVTVLDRRIDQLSETQRETQRARLRRGEIGFVFQFFNLVADLSVADNVELPMLLVGASSAEARRRRGELLTTLGVEEHAKSSPRELSGGQQQRVAIARALVNRPSLLLADEPTGNLDSAAAGEVLAVLREQAGEGRSMVMVTHDPRVANVADRVAIMEDGVVADVLRPGEGEVIDLRLLSPIQVGPS